MYHSYATAATFSARFLGKAYQYQGHNTNDCGPTNVAMIVNLQLSDQGVEYSVDKGTVADAMNDRGYRVRTRFPLDFLGIDGATPPWGVVFAYEDLSSELEAAGYPELGSADWHTGGTKDELIDNLQKGYLSTLMLVWNGGGAHNVTVVGYDSETDEFLLLDPLRGGDESDAAVESRLYYEAWSDLDEYWSNRRWWFGFRNRVIIVTRPVP